MKLKDKNGSVSFIMAAGKDFVKHEMSVKRAMKIIESGTVSQSNRFEGYPLCVDDTYFFAATAEPKKQKKKG